MVDLNFFLEWTTFSISSVGVHDGMINEHCNGRVQRAGRASCTVGLEKLSLLRFGRAGNAKFTFTSLVGALQRQHFRFRHHFITLRAKLLDDNVRVCSPVRHQNACLRPSSRSLLYSSSYTSHSPQDYFEIPKTSFDTRHGTPSLQRKAKSLS
jgi:hypothetical protein